MKAVMIFVHGFLSDVYSPKYAAIRSYYGDKYDYDSIAWDSSSNLRMLFDDLHDNWSEYSHIVIIGESTGGNFAYQLREHLWSRSKQISLILASPLMCDYQRKNNVRLPISIIPQLWNISEPRNALIIVTKDDYYFDQTWLLKKEFEGVEVYSVDDTHSLEKFEEYLPKIESYIESRLNIQ